MMKRVAVLGTGEVGQRLAAGFITHGYQVVMGTANPGKVFAPKDPAVKSALTGISVTTYQNAISSADAAVLAVKGTAAQEVVESIGGRDDEAAAVLAATQAALADVRRVKALEKRPVKAVISRAVLPHALEALRPSMRDFQAASHVRELSFSTVTERRFCDQHEMSLQTATGRSLP